MPVVPEPALLAEVVVGTEERFVAGAADRESVAGVARNPCVHGGPGAGVTAAAPLLGCRRKKGDGLCLLADAGDAAADGGTGTGGSNSTSCTRRALGVTMGGFGVGVRVVPSHARMYRLVTLRLALPNGVPIAFSSVDDWLVDQRFAMCHEFGAGVLLLHPRAAQFIRAVLRGKRIFIALMNQSRAAIMSLLLQSTASMSRLVWHALPSTPN